MVKTFIWPGGQFACSPECVGSFKGYVGGAGGTHGGDKHLNEGPCTGTSKLENMNPFPQINVSIPQCHLHFVQN